MSRYGLSELGLMLRATERTMIWAIDFEIWTGAQPTREQQYEFWQATLDRLRGHVLIDAEPVVLALPPARLPRPHAAGEEGT